MLSIKFSKMVDGISISLYLLIFCMNITLQLNMFILDVLYLVVMILPISIKQAYCCIFFFNDLLMFLLQLFYHVFNTSGNYDF